MPRETARKRMARLAGLASAAARTRPQIIVPVATPPPAEPIFIQAVTKAIVTDSIPTSDIPVCLSSSSESESDEKSIVESPHSSEYWDSDITVEILSSHARPESSNYRKRAPYTGNSVRTQNRKRALIRKTRATNQSIHSFFQPSNKVNARDNDSPNNDDLAVPAFIGQEGDVKDGDIAPPSQWLNEDEPLNMDANIDEADHPVNPLLPITSADLQSLAQLIKLRMNLPDVGEHILMLRAIDHYWTSVAAGMNRNRASDLAAKHTLKCQTKTGSHRARRIRSAALELQRTGDIVLSRRGRHSKTQRVIDIDFVREDISKFLDSRRRTSASSLHWWLNDYLVKNGFDKVSARTSRKWLTVDLGFRRHNRKKGIYFDGHDREDVQNYLHGVYIPAMNAIATRRRGYCGDEMEVEIMPEDSVQAEVVVFFHDECIFYTNDAETFYYAKDGDQELRSKSLGRCIHVSDFISEHCGFLDLAKVFTPEQLDALRLAGNLPVDLKSRAIIHPGKNNDGWWDHEQLLVQIDHFLDLFQLAFPGKVAMLIFDCSANHEAFAKDALVVSRMNVFPGGKQSIMRDTCYVHATQRNLPADQQDIVNQSMVYPQDHEHFPGQAKGMAAVAAERGLLPAVRPPQKCLACKSPVPVSAEVKECCLYRILSLEHDFATEMSALQKLVQGRGHMILFLPKFHCELNPIECAWGDSKAKCRKECDCSWASLKVRVPTTLDEIPIARIRRWFRLTDRFKDSYEKGLTGRLAEFATRKYRSHRRLPESIVVAELQAEFDAKKTARMARHAAK